mgnify:FL=1|jgi:hypothetical protein
MTIRKNFLLEESVALHLEELAKHNNQTQTAVIRELIEEKIKEIDQAKKIAAFNKFVGSGTGLFGEMSIQDIKIEMGKNV